MQKNNQLSPQAMRAALTGGMALWGQWSHAGIHQRYMEPVASRSRQRCRCGCQQRATQRGMANGIGLLWGCALSVRRWVKQGTPAEVGSGT